MRLRLATLNVWGLPAPISRDPLARIEKIGAALPDLELDVVCFQEVWTGAARDLLLDATRAAGMPHHWHRERRAFDSGLLVASRWPIEAVRFRRFRLRGLPQRVQHGDYYAGKGVAVVSLATPGGPLDVANTHLHAAYADASSRSEYRSQRTAQAIELGLELAPLRHPLVAAGDLNVEESDDAFALVIGLAQCTDIAAALDAREPTTVSTNPYRSARSTDRRIDYLLCRDGPQRGIRPLAVERCFDRPIRLAGQREGADAAYSDHFGVAATLEIGPPLSSAPRPAIAPAIVEAARTLLEQARRDTRTRQRGDRQAAATGALFGAAGFASRRRFTRRSFVRATATASALGGAAFATGMLGLSEGLDPQDLRAYDAIERELDGLAAFAAQQPADPTALRAPPPDAHWMAIRSC